MSFTTGIAYRPARVQSPLCCVWRSQAFESCVQAKFQYSEWKTEEGNKGSPHRCDNYSDDSDTFPKNEQTNKQLLSAGFWVGTVARCLTFE